ncbi:MAG: hypothetical protein R6U67_08095 [Sodalinema sp.]|uniref:hypothetical protein n=1 Tax=Sodalinema sp. TaxID=3080550 RepID=UPI00396F5B89
MVRVGTAEPLSGTVFGSGLGWAIVLGEEAGVKGVVIRPRLRLSGLGDDGR